MPTTQADIQGWLKEAKREKATHLIVVCDSFDHEDYPVLVKPGQDPKERASEYQNKNMQRVMEVYALHLDWDTQLKEFRSFHYEMPPAKVPTKRAPKKKAASKNGQAKRRRA